MSGSRWLRGAAALPVLGAVASAPLAAQTAPAPVVLFACYVPTSGTVYRIDPAAATPGLPKACVAPSHVLFSWNQQGPKGEKGEKGEKGDIGPAGPPGSGATLPVFNTDFYDLSGPTSTFSGLVARGTQGQGSTALPSGAGTRLVWSAAKGALRAGSVDGTQWDAANVGSNSVAVGVGTTASGDAAFAGGSWSNASNTNAFAFGSKATASGDGAIALGSSSRASGLNAIVIGDRSLADGAYSTVIGRELNTNGFTGSMLLGDGSVGPGAEAAASASNQLTARFDGGYRFFSSRDRTRGCMISPGGQFSCTGGVAGAGVPVRGTSLYDLSGPTAPASGFVATGTLGSGSLADLPSGAGTRFLWSAARGALRAGTVDGSQWDAANVGEHSMAIGRNTTASGYVSTALGEITSASGQAALAAGQFTTASGYVSTALGESTSASGRASLAAGYHSTASGYASIALGSYVSTNSQVGSVMFGDLSTETVMTSGTTNQFTARFANGYRLHSNSALTAGVVLAAGGGAWQSISDVRKKTAFRPVDGEQVLAKLAAMPMQTWQYKAQDATIRHMGPTAQDFRAAFGLGESDTTITTIDADGVALAAARALEQRTRTQARALAAATGAQRQETAALRAELTALRRANGTLREELATVRAQLEAARALEARLERLEQQVGAVTTTAAREAPARPATPATSSGAAISAHRR